METQLPRQQSRPSRGPSAKDLAGRDSPGHLRPSADLEAQASTRPATGCFQAKGVSGVSPQPRFARGGPGPSAAGRGAGARLLWPRPQLAFLALYAPPPTPPQQPLLHGGGQGRLLTICALVSLPRAS